MRSDTKRNQVCRVNNHVMMLLFKGLDIIHQLTSSGGYELRVDLEDFEGNTAYAKYR